MDLSCEQRRLQNIADNKRILAEIGLINPFKNLPRVQLKKSGLKRKAESELPRKPKKPLLEDNRQYGSVMSTRRRSARIQGSTSLEGSEFLELDDEDEDDDEENKIRRVQPNRPNFFGAIQGVEVGASWLTRMECCRDGIHRPTVAGIHAGADGAYSIALSGGYDDNIDLGECFTYTGEGGRDLKGTKTNPKNLRMAPQSKDQTLTRGNLALSRNVDTGNPVRVIRGYKLTSPFAPEEGYRYDGLYTVEKAWFTCGQSGYMVWKFALRRCKDQVPPPWTLAEEIEGKTSPRKAEDSVKDVPVEDSVQQVTDTDGLKEEVADTDEMRAEDQENTEEERKDEKMESDKSKIETEEKNTDEAGENNMDETGENITDEAGGNITDTTGENKTDEAAGNNTDEAGENITDEAEENKTDEVRENITDEAGENKTNEAGENDTDEAGENKTDGAGENDTDEAGENKTDGAGENDTYEAGENKTDEAGENDTYEAGENKTDGAGENDTDEAGENKTDEAGENDTDEAGGNKTDGAGGNETGEAGENETGEAGDSESDGNVAEEQKLSE